MKGHQGHIEEDIGSDEQAGAPRLEPSEERHSIAALPVVVLAGVAVGDVLTARPVHRHSQDRRRAEASRHRLHVVEGVQCHTSAVIHLQVTVLVLPPTSVARPTLGPVLVWAEGVTVPTVARGRVGAHLLPVATQRRRGSCSSGKEPGTFHCTR